MTRVFGALAIALLALPALADSDADRIADAFQRHLTTHGAGVAHSEAEKLKGGGLSSSVLQRDLSAACTASKSCLTTNGAITDEMVRNGMAIVAAYDAERDLNDKIEKLKNRNDPREQHDAMLEIQQLVNKRNEAHDILTRIQQEHQRALDNIVRNMH
jgi:hypothetical protein